MSNLSRMHLRQLRDFSAYYKINFLSLSKVYVPIFNYTCHSKFIQNEILKLNTHDKCSNEKRNLTF